jgi:hypothetical protein
MLIYICETTLIILRGHCNIYIIDFYIHGYKTRDLNMHPKHAEGYLREEGGMVLKIYL